MRYMDLEGHTYKVFGYGYRYRHNYKGFYKKFIYPMSINRGRTEITQGAYASLVGILLFLLLFSQ